MGLDHLSLDQMQMLAYAAGFGAVSEDDVGIQRDVPPDETRAAARTGQDFVPGWHMPDAPAPRAAPIANTQSRALTVVEPLWRAQSAAVNTWAQHLATAARSMSAYIPGRSATA